MDRNDDGNRSKSNARKPNLRRFVRGQQTERRDRRSRLSVCLFSFCLRFAGQRVYELAGGAAGAAACAHLPCGGGLAQLLVRQAARACAAEERGDDALILVERRCGVENLQAEAAREGELN